MRPLCGLAPAATRLAGALFLALPLAAQDYTYGVQINDVLCGYVETHVTPPDGERATTLVEEKVFVMISALGSTFNTEVLSTYHLDPESGCWTFHENHIRQAEVELAVRVTVEDGAAHFVYPLEGEEKTVPLAEGVLLEGPLGARHLVRDFVEGGATSKTYPVLDVREAEVQDVTYTRVEEATLELAGRSWETLVLDRQNEVTSLRMRQWLDVHTGMAVRMEIPGGRVVELAEPAIKKRIQLADLNPTIACKVDVAISDIQAIASMKVRAVLEPTGLRLTAEDLNVPGQSFQGTVVDNRVEGVFTIAHPRYDGRGAPAFPLDPEQAGELAPYLAPEEMIEADDPVLVAHAAKVTAGAADAWEAATRLSRWVADHVEYTIPGGVGARDTYDKGTGECGAHSLLLAGLCRAAGIPARVVWGCMYVPSFGGSFGQHAWTEVHMGPAGWIPVDCTADEVDFVDSGHVRVGIYQSFSTAINMKEMEVLEHRLLPGEAVDPGARARLEPYLGSYAHPAPGRDPFRVLFQEGGLAVDIPGQMVLALREPDDHGRWVAKLTDRLYCTFPRDEGGRVTALEIHEIVRMPRRGEPEPDDEAPEELRPLLGRYRFAALHQDFTVLWDDGRLAVHDPTEDTVIHFSPTGEPGRWIDEFDKNVLSFEWGEEGAAVALMLDAKNRFERL